MTTTPLIRSLIGCSLFGFLSLNACAVAEIDDEIYPDGPVDELEPDQELQGTPVEGISEGTGGTAPVNTTTANTGGSIDDAINPMTGVDEIGITETATGGSNPGTEIPMDPGNCQTIALGQPSGAFGTTDEVCFTATDGPTMSWDAYGDDGRTITINGEVVTAGQMPWPGSAPYTIAFSSGSLEHTSWSFW